MVWVPSCEWCSVLVAVSTNIRGGRRALPSRRSRWRSGAAFVGYPLVFSLVGGGGGEREEWGCEEWCIAVEEDVVCRSAAHVLVCRWGEEKSRYVSM